MWHCRADARRVTADQRRWFAVSFGQRHPFVERTGDFKPPETRHRRPPAGAPSMVMPATACPVLEAAPFEVSSSPHFELILDEDILVFRHRRRPGRRASARWMCHALLAHWLANSSSGRFRSISGAALAAGYQRRREIRPARETSADLDVDGMLYARLSPARQ